MKIPVHSIIIKRLLIVWLCLTWITAGLVYLFERNKVDQFAVELALKHAKQLLPEQLTAIENSDYTIIPALQAFADILTTQSHFVAVDIYDKKGDHFAAAISYQNEIIEHEIESRHHQFPLDKQFHFETFDIDGSEYVQVLLPLTTKPEQIAGYFEGVYLIDQQTSQLITERIYFGVILVVLISLITTIILYPFILKLNRKLITYSDRLLNTNIELLELLGRAIASRDSSTSSHNFRVTLYSTMLAERMNMELPEIRKIIIGSFLHDIGKIGVSDNILQKQGLLSDQERVTMQQHVHIGLDIIQNSEWLAGAREIIEFHHEKYSGSGYIKGLAGEDIPLAARIFSIVDVFDALTTKRHYKEAYSLDYCIDYLQQHSGGHFDPQIVSIFCTIAEQAHKKYAQMNDKQLTEALTEKIRKYFY